MAIGSVSGWRNRSIAQIVPDKTLGTESSVVTPNLEVKNGVRGDRIDGGAVRGTNLFHSFQEFNVNEGRGAYFANPAGIENILSRVTGGNVSQILGTLGVAGNANLFLINPNGVIFGSNARLDVEGSFLATTANAVRLGNTRFFSASDPQMSNLLTIQPSALFFTAQTWGIVNRSQVGLQVRDGQTLALVGGNVALEGGNLTVLGGRIELGGLLGSGIVELNNDGSLSFPNGVERGDVLLTNEALVDVSASGGGFIAIKARDLNLSDRSEVRGGQIEIKVRNQTFSNESRVQGDQIGIEVEVLSINSSLISVTNPVEDEEVRYPKDTVVFKLLQEVIDVAMLIGQNLCEAGKDSEFVVTGRGGLPSNPYNALDSNTIVVDWITLKPEIEVAGRLEDTEIKRREDSSSPRSFPQSSETLRNAQSPIPNQTIETQGWVVGEDGKVSLTARAPNLTLHSFWQKPVECENL